MLTKSDLQSLRQCARKLWLEKDQPEAAIGDDRTSSRRAMDGNLVGEKARDQLGRAFLWPPGGEDQRAAAEHAKRLIEESPGRPAAEVPMVLRGFRQGQRSFAPRTKAGHMTMPDRRLGYFVASLR